MVADSHLAKDVTQGVFVALAQNARQLAHHPVLSGWLHRTTQNLAANVVRTNVRRQTREQEAVVMNELLAAEPDANWEHIAPHLDAALGALSEPDRDAVLLRYFERKSAHEMSQVLGISDEAAQKRVNRAVERLREFFAQRGVTVGASGLAVVITANAVQAAPIGLAVTISTAALLTGTAVSTSTIIAATKTIAMTTLQKTLVTATVAVLTGAGIYEARQAAQLREQNQTLQQQQSPLAEQSRQLQRERDEATNRLARLIAENEQLQSHSNETELLKLRGEIGVLRQQANGLERLQQENRNLLSQITAQSDPTNRVSAEDQFILRQTHSVDATATLLTAFKNYTAKNNGQYPVNFDQLIASGELVATNFSGNLGLSDFEFANDGSADAQGNKTILNLRVPIPRPGKSSVTVWGCITGDGVIQTHIGNVSSE